MKLCEILLHFRFRKVKRVAFYGCSSFVMQFCGPYKYLLQFTKGKQKNKAEREHGRQSEIELGKIKENEEFKNKRTKKKTTINFYEIVNIL